MKREIKIALLVLFGFLGMLWVGKPLRELLLANRVDFSTARLAAGLLVRVIMIVVAIQLIRRLSLLEFNGLKTWGSSVNKQAIILPLVIIATGIRSNWLIYAEAEPDILGLFIFSVLAIGMLEELVFRGMIFPLFIKAFKNNTRPILVGAVLSNLLFGSTHFINLLEQPGNLIGITSQVFFALSIGVFFCGLMVRTENILIPSIVHALINFSFGAGELKTSAEEILITNDESVVNWNSLIPTTLFFALIFASGVYMILQVDKEHILQKLLPQ